LTTVIFPHATLIFLFIRAASILTMSLDFTTCCADPLVISALIFLFIRAAYI
jgi:hypothetical protein